MRREQKVGFTILILIVGFAGAFCFRREPLAEVALPALQDENELNQLIAEYRMRPYLPGIDTDDKPNPQQQLQSYLVDSVLNKKPNCSQQEKVPEPIRSPAALVSLVPKNPKNILPKKHSQQHDNNKTHLNLQALPAKHQRKPGETLLHIVEPGETLSGIAQQYLGSASRFGEIFDANQDVLSGPNQLKPNMKLIIPAEAKKPAPEIIKEANKPANNEVSVLELEKTNQQKPATQTQKTLIGSHQSQKQKKKKLFLPAKHSPFANNDYAAKKLAQQPSGKKRSVK